MSDYPFNKRALFELDFLTHFISGSWSGWIFFINISSQPDTTRPVVTLSRHMKFDILCNTERSYKVLSILECMLWCTLLDPKQKYDDALENIMRASMFRRACKCFFFFLQFFNEILQIFYPSVQKFFNSILSNFYCSMV